MSESPSVSILAGQLGYLFEDDPALRDVPVAVGVGAGERKVQPILGALRSGAVRTLVTDVATAEAVVAMDAA